MSNSIRVYARRGFILFVCLVFGDVPEINSPYVHKRHFPRFSIPGYEIRLRLSHFTTITCEPNQAKRHTESHIQFFCEILPCTDSIEYTGFEDFESFLCLL